MPRLVICEKPSVAGDVAGALGVGRSDGCYRNGEWIITWAFGHLLSQADPAHYNPAWSAWALDILPIMPERFEHTPRDDKAAKHLRGLAGLAADADGLVNACDAGREGELIFALIRDHIAPGLPVERAWFSSMTHDAIRAAFADLKPGADYAGLEAAARARSEADWLVGLNATRAATVRLGGQGNVVSIGRVQTPTLALIANRDTEIDSFVASTFWTVHADLSVPEGSWQARWTHPDSDRFDSAETAQATADAIAAAGHGTVVDVVDEERAERPPTLYDLTLLQREANRRHGMTAAKTLAAAQALYETHKLLTYPRTDSRYVTSDMADGLADIAGRVAGLAGHPDPAVSDLIVASAQHVATSPIDTSKVVNDAKVTDHHAIIPTDTRPDVSGLSNDELAIWTLVARRFLAVFHPPARYQARKLTTEVVDAASTSHTLVASGRVLVDPGWKAVDLDTTGATGDDDGDGDGDDTGVMLPLPKVGDRATVEGTGTKEGKTTPPPRWNEASLLGAMETAGRLVDDDEAAEAMKERGLGTPATRASIIERLIAVGYVERAKKNLVATSKGRALIGLLAGRPIASPELTGSWEAGLAGIEKGTVTAGQFDAKIRDYTAKLVAMLAELERGRMDDATKVADCPRCEGRIREGKRGWGCTSWRSADDKGCGFVVWKTKGGKKVTVKQLQKAIADNVSDADPPPQIGDCPNDGCPGKIVARAKAYGCDSWRSKDDTGCGWVLWRSQGGQTFDDDAVRKILADGGAIPKPVERPGLCACPVEGCAGTLRLQRGGKGWSCDSWRGKSDPGCGTVIWRTSKKGGAPLTDDAAREVAAKMAAGT